MHELSLGFEGRIARSDFWRGLLAAVLIFVLATVTVSLMVSCFAAVLDLKRDSAVRTTMLAAANAPVLGAFSWSFLAVVVKRCHDRGKSGLWSLLLLIPVLSWIWFVIDLGLLPGDHGPNNFGVAPVCGNDGV